MFSLSAFALLTSQIRLHNWLVDALCYVWRNLHKNVIVVDEVVVLYGQRINVEIHNAERLSCHPGYMVTYDSKDLPEGSKQRRLQHILADKVLICN